MIEDDLGPLILRIFHIMRVNVYYALRIQVIEGFTKDLMIFQVESLESFKESVALSIE